MDHMHWMPHTVGWIAVLILMGLALPTTAQPADAVLEGRVVDAQTGASILGVNVAVESAEATTGTSTDADGRYRLTGLPPGSYQLEASAIGYDAYRAPVRVARGETVTLDVELERRAYRLDEVVVSATRREEELATIPSSVSVLGPETVEQQTALTSDLGDVLAQTVPGLGPSTHSLSNYGQTLRGRNLFVLIDGVPQTVPLRNGLRDLRTINPSAIGRVEVVRGASALYGYGGGGGVINIIPERPQSTRMTFRTEVGTRFSPANAGDSFSGRLAQQVSGQRGGIDYLVSGAYERWGYFFDGEGDRIPQDPHNQGGLAGANEFNVRAHVGTQLDAQQRIDASFNVYDFKQDLAFVTEAGTPGETKARATSSDTIPGENPGTTNWVASLNYTHGDVAGSRLSAKAYRQDYSTRFGFATFYPDGGGQSVLNSEKLGFRFDVSTPLALTSGSTLLWGVDALRDETSQPLEDDRTYVPAITQLSAAPFAQAKLPFGERVVLRGGARYETFRLSVDDFTTLFPAIDTDGDGTADARNDVDGGTLTYDHLVVNVGGVVTLVDGVDLFGGFSQGFSVADVGRALRGTQAESVEALRPEAQTVNNYEMGLRGGTAVLNGSVAGFINTSDLGSTFGDFPELDIIRSPERIRGIEADINAQPTQALHFGGTLTVQEGKRDADDDGEYETYLPGSRIPPTKVTGYVAYTPGPNWQNRIQVLHSGVRDRFDGDAEAAFGQGDIAPYTVVDLSTAYAVGPGTVKLGIENLFDTFYFPTISQWYNLGYGYTAAPGRQVSLSYTVTW